jgi:hypothetical protein
VDRLLGTRGERAEALSAAVLSRLRIPDVLFPPPARRTSSDLEAGEGARRAGGFSSSRPALWGEPGRDPGWGVLVLLRSAEGCPNYTTCHRSGSLMETQRRRWIQVLRGNGWRVERQEM